MTKSGPIVGVSDKEEKTRRIEKGPEVWKLHAKGYNLREIEEKTDIPFGTAGRWIREDASNFNKEREASTEMYMKQQVTNLDELLKHLWEHLITIVKDDETGKEIKNYLDTKISDQILKTLASKAKLLDLGVKDEGDKGEGSLESILLACIQQRKAKEIEDVITIDVEVSDGS